MPLLQALNAVMDWETTKTFRFTMRNGSCAAGLACEQMKTCTTGIRRFQKVVPFCNCLSESNVHCSCKCAVYQSFLWSALSVKYL